MSTLNRLFIVLATLALGSVGCQLGLVRCEPEEDAAYVLVEHEAAAVVASTTPPEVHEASTYAQIYPTVKTIGLLFPDNACKTESAAIVTGQAINSQSIMETQCGVWLAELERALTDQKFKVISWSAIRQEQETKRITTYEAARSLGADIVFVVNSMETNDLLRDSSRARRTAYFTSDETGRKGEKLTLGQTEREPLKAFVASHAGRVKGDDVYGWAGTLDVTAVLATTGESIWFFRHSVSRPRFKETGMRFLFRKAALEDGYVAVRPKGIPEAVVDEDRASEDYEQTSVIGGPADRFKAEKHDLARNVARECVQRFYRAR